MKSGNRWIGLLPNVISTARLALAVLLPFAPRDWWLAIIIAAGLSDWLDGQIARRLDVTSVGGGLLDGIADKLFVLSAMITLTVDGHFAPWQAGLVLARDLAVAGIVFYVALRRDWAAFGRMTAGWIGKLATAAQFVLFIVALTAVDFVTPALTLTIAASLVAAFTYFGRFIRELLESRKTPEGPSSAE